jgi:hypothetical protein
LSSDSDDSRHHYQSLSDEALLNVEREELTDQARDYYEEELVRRGLQYPPTFFAAPELNEPLCLAAVYLFSHEAMVARALLQSHGIRCYLENRVYVISGVGLELCAWRNSVDASFRI